MSVSSVDPRQPIIETNRPILRAGYAALALKLQEAAGELSSNDIMARLRDAIGDEFRAGGTWAYVVDWFGDAESGDVIYSRNGDFFKAPYEISGGDGTAAKCVIVFSQAMDVVPRTIYEEEADEDDHYAAMEESYKRDELYAGLPLYERFISKSERDAADAEDFAGKGKSFPILKATDVAAAAHALGRAGSANLGTSTIKNRIIAIAKRKGWAKYLPKAWQGTGDTSGKESAVTAPGLQNNSVRLVESSALLEDIPLVEAFKSGYQIKLIAPGKGSTAYYTPEVLKRDGPKVFRAGLPMEVDHRTKAEEAARPEGSVKDWAGVLAKDAFWLDSHVTKDGKDQGPGLYSEIKPFSDHVQTIDEKGPYAGVSIRANGSMVMENKKPVMREGVPILAALTSAQSVDMVTRAGAGGMFLRESAMKTTEANTKKDCPDCKGTGDCAACNGTGKVVKAAEAKAKGKPKEMVDCTECGGTGDCATCDGSGDEVVESAVPANRENEMDESTIKRIVESAVGAAIAPLKADLEKARADQAPLLERALKGEAALEAKDVLSGVSMKEAGKQYVIAECLKVIPVKDGKLDTAAFRESVTAKAKELAPLIAGDGARVVGLGIVPVQIDAKEAAQRAAENQQLRESSVNTFSRLMNGNKQAAEAAATYKGVAVA